MLVVRLKEWRERRGLSMRALAARAGVSYPTVARIEGGHMSPTVSLLEKLAGALEIPVRDFFPTKRRPQSRRRNGR